MSDYEPCVWCNAAWDGPAFPDPDHLPSCPVVTGLWPIREQDLGELVTCDCGCGHSFRWPGMLCPGCDEPFHAGDLTVHRSLSEDVVTALCLSCAAFDRPIPDLPSLPK